METRKKILFKGPDSVPQQRKVQILSENKSDIQVWYWQDQQIKVQKFTKEYPLLFGDISEEEQGDAQIYWAECTNIGLEEWAYSKPGREGYHSWIKIKSIEAVEITN